MNQDGVEDMVVGQMIIGGERSQRFHGECDQCITFVVTEWFTDVYQSGGYRQQDYGPERQSELIL